ncbi:hypothetical protein HAV_00364 [Candidatus Hepatincola sp. Av]
MILPRKLKYWTDVKIIYKEIHEDKEHDFALIIGRYNHLDKNPTGLKFLGAIWIGHSPEFDTNEPIVIPDFTRNAVLFGLLQQATIDNNSNRVQSLQEAIEYFKK